MTHYNEYHALQELINHSNQIHNALESIQVLFSELAHSKQAQAPIPRPDQPVKTTRDFLEEPSYEWDIQVWGNPSPGSNQIGGYLFRTTRGREDKFGLLFGSDRYRIRQIREASSPDWSDRVIDAFIAGTEHLVPEDRNRYFGISTLNRPTNKGVENERNHCVFLTWDHLTPTSAMIVLPDESVIDIKLYPDGRTGKYVGTA